MSAVGEAPAAQGRITPLCLAVGNFLRHLSAIQETIGATQRLGRLVAASQERLNGKRGVPAMRSRPRVADSLGFIVPSPRFDAGEARLQVRMLRIMREQCQAVE